MTNEENIRGMDTRSLADFLVSEFVNKKGITTFTTTDNTKFNARSQSDEDYDLAAAEACDYEEKWLRQEI